MDTVYGAALLALGCWAAYTTSRTLRSRDPRPGNRTLGLVGVLFVASCLLPGLALIAERFAPWTLLPLGSCFLALIPFPCYFRRANEGRVRTARAVLFLLVGAGLLAAGLGRLPLSWFGL